jgi:sugar-specific transcriptional regulator TrmB
MIYLDATPWDKPEEKERKTLKGLKALGLCAYDALIYTDFVKCREGYPVIVTRNSRVPRAARYRSVKQLTKIGAIQQVCELPPIYRAITAFELYFGKIKRMKSDLDTANEGVTLLRERRFENEKPITDALVVMGLTLNEARIYTTLAQHGDCNLAKIVHYSGVSRQALISVIARGTLRRMGLTEGYRKNPSLAAAEYHANVSNQTLAADIESLESAVGDAIEAVRLLQAMYYTVPIENKDIVLSGMGRIWQARIILERKNGINEESIRKLKRDDFFDMGWKISFNTFEKVQERLLNEYRRGKFI